MEQIIFGGLCGILYVIGLLFGWNYQETSVYICIYLWPILCIVSTIPMMYTVTRNIVLNRKRYLNLFLLPFTYAYNAMYLFIFGNVLQHYCLVNSPIGKNTVNIVFKQCYNDLVQIANSCNVSYAEANLHIYVVLFSIIVITNYLVYKLIKTGKVFKMRLIRYENE